MKIVQRGNKQLRVEDDRLISMLADGYVEIDENTGVPVNVETSEEKADKALKKENASLKKENKELKAQVADLVAKLEPSEKTE